MALEQTTPSAPFKEEEEEEEENQTKTLHQLNALSILADAVMYGKERDQINIHQLTTRILQTFQDLDLKMYGGQLSKIIQANNIPSELAHQTPFTQLPCTEYSVNFFAQDGKAPGPLEDVDYFFEPEVFKQLKSRKQREQIYWQILLQSASGLLPIVLKEIAAKLRLKENGSHSAFLAEVNRGKNQVETVKFKDIQFRSINFTPLRFHLIQRLYYGAELGRTEQIEFTLGRDFACHYVLVWGNWIFDPTSLQYGMRGASGELVGRAELVSNYVERFPGIIASGFLENEGMGKDRSDYSSLLNCHKGMVDKIVGRVLGDLKEGRVWCSYCGKLGVGITCCCNDVWYCGKYCQVADSGHRPFCKKQKKQKVKQA